MSGRQRLGALGLVIVVLLIATAAGALIPLLSGGSTGNAGSARWTPPSPGQVRTATARPSPTSRTATPPKALAQAGTATGRAAVPAENPTARPGVIATATIRPSRTSLPLPSPFPTRTPTATATATSTRPPRPTSTPTRVPTPTPTRTLTPTPRPTPEATATPALPGAPALVQPADAWTVTGIVRFEWQANGPLPPGVAYEVVWWNAGEDPAAARGLAPPTEATSLDADLDALARSNQLRGPDLYWTVLLVRLDPYERLTLPGEAAVRLLRVQPSGAPQPPAADTPTPEGNKP